MADFSTLGIELVVNTPIAFVSNGNGIILAPKIDADVTDFPMTQPPKIDADVRFFPHCVSRLHQLTKINS